MSDTLPGSCAPGAGFEAPLEMLSACHARIERQCATLRRLVPHLAAHGTDADARAAAAAVMRYFDTSAVHHHADEEADLFPALLEAIPGSDPVCLRELVDALPAGIHSEVGERGVRLSGGQRQRLAIARALYQRREFLVLDEATSALDADTERDVLRAVRALHGRTTLLVIAHSERTLAACDRIERLPAGPQRNVVMDLHEARRA